MRFSKIFRKSNVSRIKKLGYFISDVAYDAYAPIRRLAKRLWYIATWVPFLWKHDDYDYHDVLRLMEYQLKRLRDHIIKHAMHTPDSVKRNTKEINDCLNALSDMMKDGHEICEKEWAAHEKKWGQIIWWTADRKMNGEADTFKNKFVGSMVRLEREKVKGEKDKAQETKESTLIWNLEGKKEAEAGKKFMALFLKAYKGWWC